MSGEDLSIHDQPKRNVTLEAMQEAGAETIKELKNEQVESTKDFQASLEEFANPMAAKLSNKQKEIKTRQVRKPEKSDKSSAQDQMKEFAEQFEGRNPELKSKILMILRAKIQPDDTKEDVLRKLAEVYPDVTLRDEAFDFLVLTTTGEQCKLIQEVRKEFRADHEKAIIQGRNISAEARKAADKGLGTASDLRSLYREIVQTTLEAHELFEELSTKYKYEDLKKVMNFILHSIGADLKSGGPSIPPPLLHQLYNKTRSCQAILGVYRVFRLKMALIEKLLAGV